ncbi:MAG: hypothetical protein ACK4UO_08700 [Pseudolabrys sp.]
MAYAHTVFAPRHLPATAPKTGFFSRLFAAMQEARLRQAEREIAAYIVRSGGKFTDETERDIERRFLGDSSRL